MARYEKDASHYQRTVKVAERKNSSSTSNGEDSKSPQGRRVRDDFKMVEDMLVLSKKRRDTKRRGIISAHKSRVEKAHAEIKSFYETREEMVSDLRNKQLVTFEELLHKRKAIEARIISILKTIEQDSLNISSELYAMWEGRLEDIIDIQTTNTET